MKIRLLIPECEKFNGYYSYESKDLEGRIDLLNYIMKLGTEISLVVTSHNYFQFNSKPISDIKNFIEQRLIPSLNKGIQNKIPLVYGFDFVLNKGRSKKKVKIIKYGTALNPYGGISAVVCFLKVLNKSYVYGTHIWECWSGVDNCDPSNFKKQNKNRLFKLGSVSYGLLSCGDIADYCHNNGILLPEVNIYLDLSHKSLTGRTSQYNVPYDMVNEWKKCKHVLITHQVKSSTISKYIRDQYYPFIYPKNTNYKIQEICFDCIRGGALIDVNL